jgi:hypothetical protein
VDYEFVAHPPPGHVPVGYFQARDAWNLSLNPLDYRTPQADQVRVRLYEVRGDDIDRANPLALDYFAVENTGFGIPNCVIFRPARIEVAAGRRYWVEVDGLERRDGSPATVVYLVEFIP